MVVLMVGVSPAQAKQRAEEQEALAKQMKHAVDAALAKMVRELRADLYRAIDQAVTKSNPLDTLLKDLDESGTRQEGLTDSNPMPETRLRELEALERRLTALIASQSEAPAKGLSVSRNTASSSELPSTATWADLGLVNEIMDESAVRGVAQSERLLKVRVLTVSPRSPASLAGIKPLDVLSLPLNPENARGEFSPGARLDLAVNRSNELESKPFSIAIPSAEDIEVSRMMAEMTSKAFREVVPQSGTLAPTPLEFRKPAHKLP
jgi:hypothetical protein